MAILCFVLTIISVVVYMKLNKRNGVEWLNVFIVGFIILTLSFCL